MQDIDLEPSEASDEIPMAVIGALFVAGLIVGGCVIWIALQGGQSLSLSSTPPLQASTQAPTVRLGEAAAGAQKPVPGLPEREPLAVGSASPATAGPEAGRADPLVDPPALAAWPPSPRSPSARDNGDLGHPADRQPACGPSATIRFGLNSSIPESSATAVEQVSRWMEQHPAERLVLEGHADAKGAPEDNLVLSFRRAAAVKAEFIRQGLSRDRIEITAFGDRSPIGGKPTTAAENRRVTVVVKDRAQCNVRTG